MARVKKPILTRKDEIIAYFEARKSRWVLLTYADNDDVVVILSGRIAITDTNIEVSSGNSIARVIWDRIIGVCIAGIPTIHADASQSHAD